MLGLGCFGVRQWWLTWVCCLGSNEFFFLVHVGEEKDLLAEA